jgi:flagellar motility protein MotE (MotC chaperone)
LDILTNLSKRREALEVREKELEIKESALLASESRINDKIIEMKNLKEEVDKVLALYNEKQEAEIRGLVKIYEAMKPLDAAAIFNEMEMPILLEVIDKMSERKVAPVLAGMNPKRARDVTQELAEMRKVRADLKNQAAGL